MAVNYRDLEAIDDLFVIRPAPVWTAARVQWVRLMTDVGCSLKKYDFGFS